MATEAPSTLAARLASIAVAHRHTPLTEIPVRVPAALGAMGIAVASLTIRRETDVEVRTAAGLLWRVVARIAVTLRCGETGETLALECDGVGQDAGPAALPEAVDQATMILWSTLLGIDLYGRVPDLDPEDFAMDAGAWERHLRAARHPNHTRNSWRKWCLAFDAAGVLHARRGAAVDAITRYRGAQGARAVLPRDVEKFLDTPAAESLPAHGDLP